MIGYKLLLSCWRYFAVLYLDDDAKFKDFQIIRPGWYWGFTYDQCGRFFISQKHSDPPGYYPIYVLDHNFKVIRRINELPEYGSNVHQIQCYGEKLYVLCAHNGHVLVYDLNNIDGDPEIWKPEGLQRYSYMNTLFFHKDHIYIMEHNMGYNNSIISEYMVNSRRLEHKHILYHKKCHNIFELNNEMCYCASHDGCICNLRGESVVNIVDGSFVRGVAMDSRFLFVGDSKIAERSNRGVGDGRIMVYNTDNSEFVRSINIEKCGQIHEIRLLNRDDLCHNGY